MNIAVFLLVLCVFTCANQAARLRKFVFTSSRLRKWVFTCTNQAARLRKSVLHKWVFTCANQAARLRKFVFTSSRLRKWVFTSSRLLSGSLHVLIKLLD